MTLHIVRCRNTEYLIEAKNALAAKRKLVKEYAKFELPIVITLSELFARRANGSEIARFDDEERRARARNVYRGVEALRTAWGIAR